VRFFRREIQEKKKKTLTHPLDWRLRVCSLLCRAAMSDEKTPDATPAATAPPPQPPDPPTAVPAAVGGHAVLPTNMPPAPAHPAAAAPPAAPPPQPPDDPPPPGPSSLPCTLCNSSLFLMSFLVLIGVILHQQAMVPAVTLAPGRSVEITTQVPGADVLFLVAGGISTGLKAFLHQTLRYVTRVEYLNDHGDSSHHDRMRGAHNHWCAHACGSSVCTIACETAAASTTTTTSATAWYNVDAEPSYCEMFVTNYAKAVRKHRFQTELDTVGGASCQMCAAKHKTRAEQLRCAAPRAFHGAFPVARATKHEA
jgi:hypothetical protein